MGSDKAENKDFCNPHLGSFVENISELNHSSINWIPNTSMIYASFRSKKEISAGEIVENSIILALLGRLNTSSIQEIFTGDR